MPGEPEAYAACRFYVKIGGETTAIFTEVSGLQIELDVMDYQEGGNNNFTYRLPGYTKVSNLTLKRGITRSNTLFKWCAEVASGKLTQKNVSIIMYDTAGNKLLQWDFDHAYPIKWVGPQFRAADNTNAVETLELVHDGIKLS